MSVKIAHASQDENKNLKGGQAGDQTQKEVCVRDWYNRPWNVVIRSTDSNMREKIAICMENAAKNDMIGYDQNQRNTLLAQVRKYNYDVSKVTTPCETDCSALVSVACMYAGVPENVLFVSNNSAVTSNIKNRLLSTGKFQALTESKYISQSDYLLRGDILLSEGHHVAVAISDGNKVKTSSTSVSSKFSVGIDVSKYQGNIDWNKVKAAGVNFAILKITDKNNDIEESFERNYTNCTKAGVKIYGCYNYSYAVNTSQAIAAANSVIRILKGRKITVFLDVEDKCQQGIGTTLIDIIDAYKNVIEKAGLDFMIYTGVSFYNSYIKPYADGKYYVWLARYGGGNDGTYNESYKPNIKNMVGWQYTSKGQIPGISGYVDMNVWYDDVKKESSTSILANTIPKLVKVTTTLNIRSTYNTTGNILGTYKLNDIVKVLEYKNEWYRTNKGWISSKYTKDVTGKVTCNKLNVRKEPNKNTDNVLFTITKNTMLQITDISNDDKWIKVLINNKTGWCSVDYIEY